MSDSYYNTTEYNDQIDDIKALEQNGDCMDPKLLKKWIEALRSGNYAQTRGALRRCESIPESEEGDPENPVGFCCLGVLADILNVKWEQEAEGESEPVLGFHYDGDYNDVFCDTSLPACMAEDLGLTETTMDLLMSLNDGWFVSEKSIKMLEAYYDPGTTPHWRKRPYTFNEIADVLEEHLLEKYGEQPV